MNNALKIASYNSEGFSLGKRAFIIESLIKDSKCDFICVQEHWLYNSELDVIHKLCDNNNFDCFAISSMKDDRVRIGRGYGGVCIMWNKNLSSKITPIENSSKLLNLNYLN